MSTLVDYLSTRFVTQDSIDTQKQVADAQQAILDRQYAEGKRNVFDYYNLSSEVQAAGTANQKYVDENGGAFGFLKIIPWWLWLLVIGGIFFYIGGFSWLRNILKKKS